MDIGEFRVAMVKVWPRPISTIEIAYEMNEGVEKASVNLTTTNHDRDVVKYKVTVPRTSDVLGQAAIPMQRWLEQEASVAA